MKLTGENRSTRRKTSPSATLSTKNLTWTDSGSNPGLRDESPATNRLSHGTAFVRYLCRKKAAYPLRWKPVLICQDINDLKFADCISLNTSKCMYVYMYRPIYVDIIFCVRVCVCVCEIFSFCAKTLGSNGAFVIIHAWHFMFVCSLHDL
jgi:hypothetical protein